MKRARRELPALVACAALVWGCFPGDGVIGTPLAYQDCGDGTVADLVTGLMWEKKVEGGDDTTCLTELHGVGSKCTWAQAYLEWIPAVNAEGYAGYSDWRIPHVKELQSIVDYSVTTPAIQPIFGPTGALICCGNYWSSTWEAGDIDGHWTVDFDNGSVSSLNIFLHPPQNVRAVREGQCP
jgi:hypothetical protein